MLKRWDKRKLLPLVVVILLLGIWQIRKSQTASNYITLSGITMGAIVYNVKYHDPEKRNLQSGIDSLLNDLNNSLSTYVESSEISQFNLNDSIAYQTDHLFRILEESRKIHLITDGAFDPTVGPLVNAYGFGPGKQRLNDMLQLDSLLRLVGFDLITFDHKMAIKQISGSMLDFSAIAKGYAVDVIHEYLQTLEITEFMVEIGGEVSCRGKNAAGTVWRIGIEDPTVGRDEQRLLATVLLQNQAMATSGNYRNYYELDGKKYSHTIDPKTGQTVNQSLLSVSVFAPTCMKADALATGFMVLGLEKSQEKVASIDSVEAFFVYSNENGNIETIATKGIEKMIIQ